MVAYRPFRPFFYLRSILRLLVFLSSSLSFFILLTGKGQVPIHISRHWGDFSYVDSGLEMPE